MNLLNKYLHFLSKFINFNLEHMFIIVNVTLQFGSLTLIEPRIGQKLTLPLIEIISR